MKMTSITQILILSTSVAIVIIPSLTHAQPELNVDFAETWPQPDPPKHRVYLQTPYGPISGGVWDLNCPNIGVRAFLGVPYAMPPLGNRRFRVSVRHTLVFFGKCLASDSPLKKNSCTNDILNNF